MKCSLVNSLTSPATQLVRVILNIRRDGDGKGERIVAPRPPKLPALMAK